MAVVAVMAAGWTTLPAATLTLIAPLPGGSSTSVDALSADGSTLVGHGNSANTLAENHWYGYDEPWRWTRQGGMQSLRGMNDNPTSVSPSLNEEATMCVSADGSTVWAVLVPPAYQPQPPSPNYLAVSYFARWTESDGWKAAAGFPSPAPGTMANGLSTSADGRILVGNFLWDNDGSVESFPRDYRGSPAMRWEAATGPVPLPSLYREGVSWVSRVNGDGRVVVGTSYPRPDSSAGLGKAFRWTPEEGLVDLGGSDEPDRRTVAMAVSDNGEYVVGYYQSPSSVAGTAFLWHASTGLRKLPGLNGEDGGESYAYRVTNTGVVLLRAFNAENNLEYFVYSQAKGLRTIRQMLGEEYALDVKDWGYVYPADISPDGRYIAGNAFIDSKGAGVAWIADLEAPPPLPHAIVLGQPRIDDGAFVLPVESTPGIRYQLQTTAGLETSDWHDLGPALTGTGSPLELRGALDGAQRYYRVVSLVGP